MVESSDFPATEVDKRNLDPLTTINRKRRPDQPR